MNQAPGSSEEEPTAPIQLPHRIFDALERLGRGQRSHRQAVASQHGLSPLQIELLGTLAGGPPPEPLVGALARELAVTQPTITDSLRALEDKSLLTRRPSTVDRRRTVIELTDAGAALADQLATADRAVAVSISSLDSTTQEQLFEGLLDLIARLVAVGVIDVARTCTTCRHHRLRTDGSHRCQLLEIDLPVTELRVNCPEHAAVELGRPG